jgi:hypothetical protein
MINNPCAAVSVMILGVIETQLYFKQVSKKYDSQGHRIRSRSLIFELVQGLTMIHNTCEFGDPRCKKKELSCTQGQWTD